MPFSDPEVVIGIDFGMTSTGITYSLAPHWPDPKPIQSWPSTTGTVLRNKVPTALAYDIRGEKLKAWGCSVDFGDLESMPVELFKLHLDPNFKDPHEEGYTLHEAQRYFRDYMGCIRNYVLLYLEQSIPRAREKKLEWLISTPTTWRSPGVVAVIEELLHDAGFSGLKEKLTMSLTEAEAAAVYASKFSYAPGDIIMVCDAGGGTTDLNILGVREVAGGAVQLEQLLWVEGEAIGSTLIDFHIERKVASRLRALEKLLKMGFEEAAEETVRFEGRFESYKCAFGSETTDSQRPLWLPIAGLDDKLTAESDGIVKGNVVITREELQEVFDQQIEASFRLVDEHIDRMVQRQPGQRIAYLILSGGLGSSPYVRSRMVERYQGGQIAGTSGIRVLVAAEAQLAVAYGLVSDRMQDLRHGPAMFENHCARNSYGVVTQELYDPMKHKSNTPHVYVNKSDGRKWVANRIRWLLKKGEQVSTSRGVTQPCQLRLEVGREATPWQVQIVMSSVDLAELPDHKSHPAVEPVCTVTSLIDPSLMKMKNRHWYQTKQPYWLAEFQLKIIVGAADLRFELWDSSGSKCSREHDRITVKADGIHRGEGEVYEVEG